MRLKASYIIIAILWILGSISCKKERILTSGGIVKFSVDTLKFDTVFTAAGSFTTGVLIYNPQNEEIKLSSVRLENGATSYFHLNVDGFEGNNIPDLKIRPHDSIYVFATVNINPNDTLTPFLVTDNLIATLNGKSFSIPFTAYGQNAHYIVGDSLGAGTTTWLTDKPYVVIHNAVVGPGATLNIPANCRVYMHQDARFLVYGALNVNPEKTDSVVFQGDRLDRVYFGYLDYPGEWSGFWFVPGSVGHISHAVIKNCGGGAAYYNYAPISPAAIEADTAAWVTIDHSVIKNSISIGLLAFQGSMNVSNSLIRTTGGQALAIVQGGSDTFTNCTFANYGGNALSHSSAGTVAILNYFQPDQYHIYYGALNARMTNCIVYGSLDSEIVCDADPINAPASLLMDHCLLKMGSVHESFVTFNSCLFNQDPMFKDANGGDMHLSTGSPAIGSGAPVTGTDLDGAMWTSGDIGCYQHK